MYYQVTAGPNGNNIWIYTGISGEHSEPDYLGQFELMQFTGLIDKNGKEIYEGDILNSQNRILQGVVYYQAPSFVVKRRKYTKTWHEFILHPSEKQFQEVIGNIYENPELLKKV